MSVQQADRRWRQAALGKKSTRAGARPAAVITAHDDGTFELRLLKFDRPTLMAVKSAARMIWDPDARVWLIWGSEDRDAVVERLRLLGCSVAHR